MGLCLPRGRAFLYPQWLQCVQTCLPLQWLLWLLCDHYDHWLLWHLYALLGQVGRSHPGVLPGPLDRLVLLHLCVLGLLKDQWPL